MEDAAAWLEHRIPDVVSTTDLPVPLAAEIDFLAGRVDRWFDQSRDVSAALSARSHAFAGDSAAALAALDSVDVDGIGLADLAAASWAASRVGGPAVDALLRRVHTEADGFWPAQVPVAPRPLWAGLLHAARGELDTAVTCLNEAVSQGDRRAPLWGSLARLELARVSKTAEAVPVAGAPSSEHPLRSARTFFAAGGYVALSARVDRLTEPVPATLVSAGSTMAGFGVQPAVAVRASKGLTAFEYLISHVGRDVTAAELAVVLDGGDAREIAALAPEVWRSLAAEGADRSDTEVVAELRSVFFDERTRSRITKLIRRTIDKLSEVHPLVGSHLDLSIRTGHSCRYEPAGASVQWRLTPES